VEPRGSSTVVDRPWLREPVSIVYPYDAEIAGREAIVEVSLLINASGEVQRYEFTGEANPEFQAAVADAIRRMHINTDELGAESYPYEKPLRVPFVLR
jgi:outer membrane biosynthesis protein TonB